MSNLDESAADALRLSRIIALRASFSPNAPINSQQLFAGRVDQLSRLKETAAQAGQHAIIYGERGAGKTSLVTIFQEQSANDGIPIAKRNCSKGDSFHELFSDALEKLADIAPNFRRLPGSFAAEVRQAATNIPGSPSPSRIQGVLLRLAAIHPFVLCFDEFDRINSDEVKGLLAETIKALSDERVAAKVFIVGVGTTVNDLMADHASVVRALRQIEMPRMSVEELKDVVSLALVPTGMNIDEAALQWIADLARGLPHYAHLLGLHAGIEAAEDDRAEVTLSDVDNAIEQSLTDVYETVRTAYEKATIGRQNMYPEVLLACALSAHDNVRSFTVGDVSGPLSQIMKRPMESRNFAPHLNVLTETERGAILVRSGSPGRYAYAFRDPLVQPYILLKGYSEGVIPRKSLQVHVRARSR